MPRVLSCSFIYFVVIIVCSCVLVHSKPFKKTAIQQKRSLPSPELFKFMKKYGYLEEGPENAEALYTEDGLSDTIKTLQKFGDIPQTGVIDNDTLTLLTKPRCGVQDVIRNKRTKRFTAVRSGGWKKREITFFIANWSPRLDRDTIKKNIILALDTWGRYGRLRFREVLDPSADIVVAFARGYHGDNFPFDGPGNILAHAFFPNEHESLGGDVHFDDDEVWKDKLSPEDEGMRFFTVALHELGHSLGLAHSPVPTSVMFPYYTGSEDNSFALDYDDILGMYELYIKTRFEGDDEVTSPPHEEDRSKQERSEEERSEQDRSEEERSEQDRSEEERSEQDRSEEDRSEQDHGRRREEDNPSRSKETNVHPTSTRRPTISSTDKYTVIYHGDDESVDDHKSHDDKFNMPPTNTPSFPDICQGHFDAVATLRGEIFFFKEQYVWRLRSKRQFASSNRHIHSQTTNFEPNKLEMEQGYPTQIWSMFPKLPKSTKRIDAAYERPDGMIVLFTGKRFWVYDGTEFIEGSPLPLTSYGLPSWVKKLDAVQNWAKNGKSYFYLGNQFWRYNEGNKSMDSGYPMHIERWRGIPENLDAATTWKDGKTYFFKGKLYWKFDNDWVIATEKSPMPAPQMWLGCHEDEGEDFTEGNYRY